MFLHFHFPIDICTRQ